MGEADEVVKVQIVAVAFKDFVVFNFEVYQKVAIDAALACGVAFAAECHLHAVVNAGRDCDIDDFLAIHNAFAVTMRARILDYLTGAMAFRAYRCLLYVSKDAALLMDYVAATVTFRASGDALRVFGSLPLQSGQVTSLWTLYFSLWS